MQLEGIRKFLIILAFEYRNIALPRVEWAFRDLV